MARKYAREQPDPHEIDLYEKLLSRSCLRCLRLLDFVNQSHSRLEISRASTFFKQKPGFGVFFAKSEVKDWPVVCWIQTLQIHWMGN